LAKCPWCKGETDILIPIRKVIKKQRYEEYKDDYICPECWSTAIDEWEGNGNDSGDEKPPCLGEYEPEDPVCKECEHGVECQEITNEKRKEEEKEDD